MAEDTAIHIKLMHACIKSKFQYNKFAIEIQDRDIIDLIKENYKISKGKKNTTDYISFLKEEITEKNIIFRKHLDIINKEMETGSLQEKNVLTSRNVSNHNDVSSIMEDETIISTDKEIINNNENNDNCNVYRNYEKDDVFYGFQIDNKCITERRKNKRKLTINSSTINFESINNLNLLNDEKAYYNELIDNDDINSAIPKKDVKQRDSSNEKRVYVNQFPERDILPNKRTDQNRSREIKTKVVIVSDSITKRINMLKFNNDQQYDNTVKRAFPGATTSQLNHYVKASLVEDKPNKIIICGGTNNLSRKNQSVSDIVKEIVEIVGSCRCGGVKQTFVSSLICNPSHKKPPFWQSVCKCHQ